MRKYTFENQNLILMNFSLVMSPCVFSLKNFLTVLTQVTGMNHMPGFYMFKQIGFSIGLVGAIIAIPNISLLKQF